MSSRIYLYPFTAADKRIIFESENFHAESFKFQSGVDAVRISNSVGSLVLLPFQGQQIWSAEFLGRNLTMKSMFTEPRATRTYLETYGGFLLHCGATAMGVPTAGDNHPLHGELPNAPYQSAFLDHGKDERGEYLALGGQYQHTVAFSCNYLALPQVKVYAGSSIFQIGISIENLKNTEMELMYLAHINFRPVESSSLVYSAYGTPESVRVRRSIPSHVIPKSGYREFLDELSITPSKHHILSENLMFDPEVVFMIDYEKDSQGWAHSMQVLPDGSADYVAHRPDELDHGIRWISRTADQDALGLVLPATAEPEGYQAEKEKGNLKIIQARSTFQSEMIVGVLNQIEATEMKSKINQILQK